jgi:3-hydroxy-9,10-secoandrosta-1,3,5(10)-triene-9,17-dione monooxygenase reductase component
VTIVTCRDAHGTPCGLTANSFGGVSLEPPLVLWSLRSASPNTATFAAAKVFNVNVLTQEQVSLSRHFASRVSHKFSEGSWSAGRNGAPVLADCAAVFECDSAAQHVIGDHLLFVGKVSAVRESTRPPLLFHAARYHQLGKLV